MRCEPIFCENCLARTDAWRHILELDPQQEGEFGHRKDAVAVLGKDDDLVPVLCQELAPPALPAEGLPPGVGLLALQPVSGRQGEQQQGKHDVHAHRSRGFFGWMLQTPLLL